MGDEPSLNGDNGRKPNGKFGVGNPGGPGNPFSAKVNRIRSAMLQAATEQDFVEIFEKLVQQAKTGDLPAIRELFDRVLGKPKSTIEIQQEAAEEQELDRSIAERLAGLVAAGKAGAKPPASGNGRNRKGKGRH